MDLSTLELSRLKLVAFDLDDTLAPSKTRVPPRMAALLMRLLRDVDLCVISGGRFEQFESQLLAALPAIPYALDRLHLMPTCGTQYFRHRDGNWQLIYAENLSDLERSEALEALERHAHALGLWEAKTWGPVLEDRGSQITFSALGQLAPPSVKATWDPDGIKRQAHQQAVQEDLPHLEVRAGGSTSLDITRRGVDKAYGMRRLLAALGHAADDVLFVGDRLDPAGNDFPVLALGVPAVQVAGWTDTAKLIERLLWQHRNGSSTMARH